MPAALLFQIGLKTSVDVLQLVVTVLVYRFIAFAVSSYSSGFFNVDGLQELPKEIILFLIKLSVIFLLVQIPVPRISTVILGS